MEALVLEAWNLAEDVRNRLAERDCPAPTDLEVEVEVTEEGGPAFADRHYLVHYERVQQPAAKAAPQGPSALSAATIAMPSPSLAENRPNLELTVLKGTATRRVYSFPAGRVYVGRLEEIADEEGRIRRRNDVVFLEESEVNQTVSREHARIIYDEGTGELRLRAEPGASNTRIFRDGKTIDVSGRDPRGIRIQSGDEIYFGRACVKVAIRPAE
jgi:hypothetical protein